MKLADFAKLMELREASRLARAEALESGNDELVATLDRHLAEYQQQIDAALAEAAQEEPSDSKE